MRIRLALAAMAGIAAPPLVAQHEHHGTASAPAAESAPMSRHMKMTDLRSPEPGDAARATRLTDDVRRGIAKYTDVRAARRDGYRAVFVGDTSPGAVLHYTHFWRSAGENRRLDPASPGSLLYEKQRDGSLRLVGAMYGAPNGSTPEELNARVPLAYARWHQHTDICVPRPIWNKKAWQQRAPSGTPIFGPASAISTREACTAVGGDFKPTVFGWMVHAMVIDNTDLASIWGGHDHEGAPAMVGGAADRR